MAASPSASPPADPPMAGRSARRRRQWASVGIVEAIRRWHELYGEPPSMADWDPYRARQIGQEWRVARYEDGDWPSAKSVRNHFGRLSTAVAAAGLVPRHQGQHCPQAELAIDAAVQLHLAHMRVQRAKDDAPSALARAVRNVVEARESREPGDLRASLVDLAAVALAWAGEAEPGRGMDAES